MTKATMQSNNLVIKAVSRDISPSKLKVISKLVGCLSENSQFNFGDCCCCLLIIAIIIRQEMLRWAHFRFTVTACDVNSRRFRTKGSADSSITQDRPELTSECAVDDEIC